MYLLRISQKALFICNLCWLTTLIFRIISLDHWPDVVVKSIVVLGELVALPVGLLWYGMLITLFFLHQMVWQNASKWLMIVNLCFIPAILIFRWG